jgi:hypothetical protein
MRSVRAREPLTVPSTVTLGEEWKCVNGKTIENLRSVGKGSVRKAEAVDEYEECHPPAWPPSLDLARFVALTNDRRDRQLRPLLLVGLSGSPCQSPLYSSEAVKAGVN